MITKSDDCNRRTMFVNNAIARNEIELMDDCTDTNIHFYYKTVEITTELCITNDFYKDPDTNESYGALRKIHIHIDLSQYLEDFEDDDSEDDNDDDVDPGDVYYSYDDQLKKNFPGMFVDTDTIRQYSRAATKIPLYNEILDMDKDSLYPFAHKQGLIISTKETTFLAPTKSFTSEEVIFWCCNIIDKILNYCLREDEEEADELFEIESEED